jgi:hypothetical protein
MRTNDGRDRIREGDSLQDFGAHLSMDLGLLKLFGGERSGLVDDVLRDREFANIVQQGGGAKGLDLVLGKTQLLGNLNRKDTHPLQMFVGGVIFRFDGQSQ